MEYGNLEITDNVLKDIAMKSLADFQDEDVSDPKVVKKLRKMVDIERLDDQTLNVNVKVSVKFGEVIPDYVKKLQDKISSDLESLTGLKVASVNVTVEEVILKTPTMEEKEEEENPE